MLLLRYPEMKRSASYRRLSNSPFSVKRIDICPWEEGVQGNLETCVYRKPTHADKYLAFDSHYPICHKKSVANTLLRRADCPPSSLDSKAEERKYVSNVLKANGYVKNFLRNCQKPVTTCNILDEREPATGFAVIPYIQGVTEPSGQFWIATTLKLLKNLLNLWGIFLPDLRILSRKNNEPKPYILFFAMTVTTNKSGRPNVSLVHVWKSIKKRVSFAEKENSALSEHTCLTNCTIEWD